ncbi:MAG: hypothetical protein DCC55_40840, partial [Chloroflexi bacterium]
MQQVYGDERPLSELFGQLTDGLGRLVQQEMRLARAELKQKMAKAQGGLT